MSDKSFDVSNLRRGFTKSESFHYHGRPITEPEANFVAPKEDFEVKAIIERESYDMIYNAGYREALNKANYFAFDYMAQHPDVSAIRLYSAFCEWVEEQRKTLK